MAEYIDREVALKRFEVMKAYGVSLKDAVYLDGVMAVIDALPAADVAPVVHGQWLSCFEDWRMQIEGDKCSVCGFEHYGTPKGEFKFCPNCGAKMDGGQINDPRRK